MLEIIAHRGYWKTNEEKNSTEAFRRAIDLGFGIETDFRDFDSRLYIAHNVNEPRRLEASKFFEIYGNHPRTLAVNIKADGLVDLLKPELKKLHSYFVFDGTVPDALNYIKAELDCYTRLSEYENFSALDEKAKGYWLDQFHGTWYDNEYVIQLLRMRRDVCVVSPELHGRGHQDCWSMLRAVLRENPLSPGQQISICTDKPEECRNFFHE